MLIMQHLFQAQLGLLSIETTFCPVTKDTASSLQVNCLLLMLVSFEEATGNGFK